MTSGATAVVLVVLTVGAGALFVVARRRDARRRSSRPLSTRSTTGAATVLPLVILGIVVLALIESTPAIRLHVALLGGGAIAGALGGSYYILRYATRTLRRQEGQPWTYNRVASLILNLLAIGLAVTALNLVTPN